MLGIWFITTIPWIYSLVGYIFVSICNGVASHRYFVHNQFSVNTTGRIFLGFLSTIGMYSPIKYWIVQHKHHHRNSDKLHDIHSPKNSILNSMFFWPFRLNLINSVFQDRSSLVIMNKIKNDKIINFFSNNFILVNLSFITVLFLINIELLQIYFVGVFLDYIRIGFINSLCHKNILGNYKNHNTNDNSHNNLILGILTLGFAWHNNHHNDSSKLILQEKWWEIDIEGLVGLAFSKIFKYKN
jgi:stearoyl-CoA desaturase (delta-9 desaturase)